MQTIISQDVFDDYSKKSQNKGKSGSKMEEFDCPSLCFFRAYFLLGVVNSKYTSMIMDLLENEREDLSLPMCRRVEELYEYNSLKIETF